MADEMKRLRDELAVLSERVDALEQSQQSQQEPAGLGGGDFWALEGLRNRLGDDPSTKDGAVMLVGSLRLPTGAPVSWQLGAGTSGLIETEWAERAAAFSALGHPVRIELLRHILAGVHATSELAAIESLGTTGQLHHHLRQLVAAGWVRQSGRGSYEIPAARVVPLLVCVLGAER